MPSTYDRLHDQYWSTTTPKAGTRYERLVAFVLKALDTEREVIHDIKLIGNSTVKHQIDVTVLKGATKKRILVECKDFDVSSNKVGLGIIRDFSAVVDDTKPDEAVVITCVGFTIDAQKFAKHKGIKLAVLREFMEEDWDGRVRTIRIAMHIMHISEPRVSFTFSEQAHFDKLMQDMTVEGMASCEVRKGQPIYLNFQGKRAQLNEFIEKETNQYPRQQPGVVVHKVPLPGGTIEVKSRGGVPIQALTLEFEILHADESFEVTSNKIAHLLLEGFEDKDLIIFEEDLKRLSINESTGEIIV